MCNNEQIKDRESINLKDLVSLFFCMFLITRNAVKRNIIEPEEITELSRSLNKNAVFP